jgi:uncharacterized C2H2 Zn-finger protein
MSRHLSTHTGLKNFQCDICSKAFTRNRDMVLHKRKIHLNERTPVTTFKCTECRKVFPTGESLQLHTSKEHAHMVEQVELPAEIPEVNVDGIHHGPHHLHHHHQGLIQPPPLLPPHAVGMGVGVGYHHQRLHPY